MVDYIPPKFNENAFNCPHCGVYAHQEWFSGVGYGNLARQYMGDIVDVVGIKGELAGMSVSVCSHCHKEVIWLNENILLPRNSPVPPPPEDTPLEVKNIYIEAGKVLNDSPRASGALMRLALELLLRNIKNNNLPLNDNIKKLVESGIPEQLTKALSILRVNGNDIMHTGEIKILENKDDVLYLFNIFNMIVEDLITWPKKLNEFYKKIPESKRKEIEKNPSKDRN